MIHDIVKYDLQCGLKIWNHFKNLIVYLNLEINVKF